ncbi:MAG: hypothetical protein JWP97_2520 [Labilithrix sp.]|nr:hypothetical protein [Labilithrix sp.]
MSGPAAQPYGFWMSRVLAVLVVAALLFGCAHGESDVIIGDEAFSLEERAAIARGAAFITAATGKPVPEIVWGQLPDDSDRRAMKIVRAPLPPKQLGDSSEGEFRIWIDADKRPERVAEIAAHEFGHALGLDHIDPAQPGLMNRIVPTTLIWTDADEASCLHYGVCAR